MTEDSRTIESLLARRELAEKATPGPWKPGTSVFLKQETIIASMGYIAAEPIGVSYPTTCYNFAHIAANSPDVVMADIDEILRLRAEVEFWRQETQDVRENFERTLQCERDKTDRLEREADWLAEQLSYSCSFTGEHNCGIPKPCPKTYGCGCLDVEAEEWREAARKAMEENHEN